MTDAQTAFLRSIAERPDDDLPRLVYADWLEDRGDPRGEFVRLQTVLAGNDCAEARAAFERREAELAVRYRSEWLRRLDGWRGDAIFERGFVEEVCVSARRFMERGESWRRVEPFRRIALYGAADCIEELANCPSLDGITHLDLSQNELEPDHVRRLLRSTHLGRVIHLDLSANHLGPATARLVLAAATLPCLRQLEFDRNDNYTDIAGLVSLRCRPRPLLRGLTRIWGRGPAA
ncbi:MAG: TIGR02996 domain-containing protein [Gemmataceae bacterium]